MGGHARSVGSSLRWRGVPRRRGDRLAVFRVCAKGRATAYCGQLCIGVLLRGRIGPRGRTIGGQAPTDIAHALKVVKAKAKIKGKPKSKSKEATLPLFAQMTSRQGQPRFVFCTFLPFLSPANGSWSVAVLPKGPSGAAPSGRPRPRFCGLGRS